MEELTNMENNNLSPQVGRNADGTFANGHQSFNKPYRRYGETLRVIEGKYKAHEIIALANQQDALDDMTPFEVMAIKQIARSLADVKVDNCSDVYREREAILDRVEGKSSQLIENKVNYQVTLNVSADLIDAILCRKEITLNAEEQKLLLANARDNTPD